MKSSLLSDLLRGDMNGPLASLFRCGAGGQTRRNGVAPRQQLTPVDGIDVPRVLAMQAKIEAGRYAPDPYEVAEGVLATIAPARRH
jgi:hypothetical protein